MQHKPDRVSTFVTLHVRSYVPEISSHAVLVNVRHIAYAETEGALTILHMANGEKLAVLEPLTTLLYKADSVNQVRSALKCDIVNTETPEYTESEQDNG